MHKSQIIVGFSQLGQESSWRVANSRSIIQAAENHNIQLLFDDAQQKQENQISAIRKFIVYKVDVIAFAPIVETGWETVLQEAKAAGIPVIVVDRKISCSQDLYAAYIGENSYEEGLKAADYLLQKSENGSVFNVLEMYGTINSTPAKDRNRGFRDGIIKNPNINIVYMESGDFLRSRGKEIIENLISKNGSLRIGENKINVIFSHNDAMSLGAIEALEKNGILPGRDVEIISFDGEKSAVNAFSNGKINCLVECNPESGPQLMELIQKIYNGEPYLRETFVAERAFTSLDVLQASGFTGF